ncbi:MAG TPA: leucyl aminopeptidase [Thermoplasmata archaeon]|nr:leucyl aminopeptidase [Thermoplasmata archaeon]
MKVQVDRRDGLAAAADVLAVGVFERPEKDDTFPRSLEREDELLHGLLKAAWARKEVKGRRRELRGELTVFHRPDGKGRLLLVGLGPRAKYTAEITRRSAAEAVKGVRGKGARTIAFNLSSFVAENVRAEAAVAALAEGATLGSYQFQRYQATSEGQVEEATVYLGEEFSRDEAALKRAVTAQMALDEVVLWTREIANLPADTASPQRLAEEAVALGKEVGLKVTVFDEKKLAEMGCGGILAVGSGSAAHPPRMVVLEYPGGARRGRTVAVVGKGITFDSGGISIKPATSMQDMKFDKSGAVAVLGILRAAATLKVPPRVIGVLCCAENVPSGTSYRPGDVVRSFNGKTIEVVNTDAEGRVVLSDGLGYAVKQFHPDEVIDLATLTGAQVTALGDDTAGLITNDDRLAQGLLAASAVTGEPVWRMPLTDYHRELVKSDIADVRNSIEIPVAGMLTASAFLESFVGTTPWAHLDIAGPAYTTVRTRKFQPAYQSIGATGFGVRLVTRYLEAAPVRT